jgi:hypothetical protein
MTLKFLIAPLAALLCVAVPALAFQEQQVGSPPAGAAAPAGATEVPAVKPAEMQLSPAEVQKPADGTEVRIPGLGKLGVLPKMDFGLELLYGANDGKPQATEPVEEVPSDDLRIRGTMKHNF